VPISADIGILSQLSRLSCIVTVDSGLNLNAPDKRIDYRRKYMRYALQTNLMLIMLVTLVEISFASDHSNKSVSETVIDTVFSEAERRLIKEHYENTPALQPTDSVRHSTQKHAGLPPGLANREALPPGLAKQLQRNGTLPPGLAKRDLPAELTSMLPPVRDGYERSVIEDVAIVLIEKASGRIADIILGPDINEDTRRSQPGRED